MLSPHSARQRPLLQCLLSRASSILQRAPCASQFSNMRILNSLLHAPSCRSFDCQSPHAPYPRATMLLSLLGELLILSVAFDQALAAPSQTDLGYRQQGGPELHNGHVFRRDDAADLRHSRSFSLPTTAATSASYITLVTPSPGASAISVTFQGQIITSYSALTVCPTTTSSSTPTALSSSSSAVSVGISSAPTISPSAITYGFPRRQVSGPYANIKTIPAPYANTTHTSVPSVPDSLVTSCSITYMPTTTAICHTTITPLGGIPVPVSACDQNITFSTDHEIASTAGSKELLTVFYVAPWPDVVTGVPTGTVQKEICNSASQCSTVQEKWSISTAMITQTQTNTLSVNTVVTGVSTASSSAVIDGERRHHASANETNSLLWSFSPPPRRLL